MSEQRTATVACPFCQTLNRVDLTRLEQHPKCGNCGKPILLDRPIAISDATFDKVTTDTTVPVVVDFYADWCGPCKIMAPLLDDVAHRRAGEMLVVKLDTDKNPITDQRRDALDPDADRVPQGTRGGTPRGRRAADRARGVS